MSSDFKNDEIIDFDDEDEKNLNLNLNLNEINEAKNDIEMNDIEKNSIEINSIEINTILNVKNREMETDKAQTTMIRNQSCPTNVRIILLKNGKQLKWNEYATLQSKNSLGDSESEDISLLDLYAWPDTSLQELGYLIANKIPSFIPSPSLKLAFKAIHVDRLVQQELKLNRSHPSKASISDLGFLFLNRPSIDSSSILFNSRFSLGDILEVSVLTRTRADATDATRTRSDATDATRTRSDLRSALKSSSARFAPYTTGRK